MKNLIGISGKIGSGKDEIYKIISSITNEEGKQPVFVNKKYAYKVKQVAMLLTGIPVEKFEDQSFKSLPLGGNWSFDGHLMTSRELLQRIGTEVGRSIHPDAWVNALFAEYNQELRRVGNLKGGTTISMAYPNWIITDVRFPNEVEAIKDREGIVIRVNRPMEIIEEEKEFTTKAGLINMHPSEIALDDCEDFDYVIENKGTLKDLRKQVEKIWEDLK